jgi:gliding motility-associated-like protein
MQRLCFLVILVLSLVTGYSQKIVDPCFASVEELGRFYGSEDVQNACPSCNNRYLATDRLQWNGTNWEGELAHNEIEDLPPPPGCSDRAIWMGNATWTTGGEAVGLRLDSPLQADSTYSYTFTYASVGSGSDHNFSPLIYTNSSSDMEGAVLVGRLPGTDGWTTNTFTFTAKQNQKGHTWLFLHTVESGGMIMGRCDLKKLYPEGTKLLGDDLLICEGSKAKLAPPFNASYRYSWSNGLETPAIFVPDPGEYSVHIQYGNCEAKDTIQVTTEDCEVRLIMPNVFTPNGDDLNERFVPKDSNFIDKGTTVIYNRWGKTVFTGDLFTGWNGKSDDSAELATGIYYYTIIYTDRRQREHSVKGRITLVR